MRNTCVNGLALCMVHQRCSMDFNYLKKAFSQNVLELGLICLFSASKYMSAVNLAIFNISHYQLRRIFLLKLLTPSLPNLLPFFLPTLPPSLLPSFHLWTVKDTTHWLWCYIKFLHYLFMVTEELKYLHSRPDPTSQQNFLWPSDANRFSFRVKCC